MIQPTKLSTPGKIDLARAALANDLPGLSKLVAAIPGDPAKSGTTKFYAVRFLEWFTDQSGPARFSVFMETGNSKLPFFTVKETSITRHTLAKAGVIPSRPGAIRRPSLDNYKIAFCYGPAWAGL